MRKVIMLSTFNSIDTKCIFRKFKNESELIEYIILTFNSFGFCKEETKGYVIHFLNHYIKMPPTDCVVKALVKHFGDDCNEES